MKKNNIIYGFISALCMAWIGNYFYDTTKSIPIIKYIVAFLNWLYDSTVIVLNLQLRLWWLILAGVSFYFVRNVIRNSAKNETPDFINYKEDVFKKWKWRWEWKLTDSGWTITRLIPYCPKDDVQLINNSSYSRISYYCPKCSTRFGDFDEPLEYEADASVLIRDKITKGYYSKSEKK